MHYLDALDLFHQQLRPSNYVEIGCDRGLSLSRSRCPAVAIDPYFEIVCSLTEPTRLFRETSDAFFAKRDLRSILGADVELAFIDGMHLAEFVLRDFANIEQSSSKSTAVLIDDVLPQDLSWATRERQTHAWTGDVYKIVPFLRSVRPDLCVEVFDIERKGLAVVYNLNPQDHTLRDALTAHEQFLSGTSAALASVEEIRSVLGPRKTEDLGTLISRLRGMRRSTGPLL